MMLGSPWATLLNGIRLKYWLNHSLAHGPGGSLNSARFLLWNGHVVSWNWTQAFSSVQQGVKLSEESFHCFSCFPHVQILDWDYYIERLGSAIQKIITIPAALQQVSMRASECGKLVKTSSIQQWSLPDLCPPPAGKEPSATCQTPRLATQEIAGEEWCLQAEEDQWAICPWRQATGNGLGPGLIEYWGPELLSKILWYCLYTSKVFFFFFSPKNVPHRMVE
jgi:hypothetical protein